MDILAYQPPGSFIVRDSSSNPGCHALSMKSPDGHIMHYLIAKDGRGYFIQVRGVWSLYMGVVINVCVPTGVQQETPHSPIPCHPSRYRSGVPPHQVVPRLH